MKIKYDNMENLEENRKEMNFARHMKHSSLSPRSKKQSSVKLIAMLAILIVLILFMIFAGCSRNPEISQEEAISNAREFLNAYIKKDFNKVRSLSTSSLDSLVNEAVKSAEKLSPKAKKLISSITADMYFDIDSSYVNEGVDTITVYYTLIKPKPGNKSELQKLKSSNVVMIHKQGTWKVDTMN